MTIDDRIKRKAISCLRKGDGLEYISINLGIDEGSLKAYKAHLTMGTYNRPNKKREAQKRYASKETIIELLRFGIPDRMILETYKCLKPKILHAYKAHITMGSYGK